MMCSIVGLCVLFMVSRNIEIGETAINKLDSIEDNSVIVSGTVVAYNSNGKVTFLKIQKDELLSITLFGDVGGVEIGNYVQIRGKVNRDSEKIEFIGEDIRVI